MSPVVAAIVQYLASVLKVEAWDGEVPRYDSNGNPINPESRVGTWPGLVVTMGNGGAAKRKRLFAGQYIDDVTVSVQVWGTERGQEERVAAQVDSVLQSQSGWATMTQVMQSLDKSVIRVIHAKLSNWSSTQEKDVRTAQSKYLYLGDLSIEFRYQGQKSLA